MIAEPGLVLSAPSTSAADQQATSGLHVNVGELLRFLRLYLVLTAFELTHLYMLIHWFSDRFAYYGMMYDGDRAGTYIFICLVTPLAMLPAGTRFLTASHFLYTILMTFVGLPSPLFLVGYTPPATFWPFYGCLFLCYLILALSTRIVLRPFPTPVGTRGYVRLLVLTGLLLGGAALIGATSQGFHIVGFDELHAVRYSDDVSNGSIQRIIALYIFSLGGLFLVLSLLFGRRLLAAIALFAYVVCYGLIYLRTAALAPFMLIFVYLVVRYISRDSVAKFIAVLVAPYYVGVAMFVLIPAASGPDGNPLMFAYMLLVNFRQYAATDTALGLYYSFFQTHPHTYWSHITGLNVFIHYPYGDKSVAYVLQDRYGLGNFNASFLATDAIQAYGYEALPLAGLVMGATYVVINTAARGYGLVSLAILMLMPALMFDERAYGTSMLTGGIIFLILFLAWMPRSWVEKTENL